MNKTDKLLYGGVGVVALAVIAAMLASVFSPLKQVAEETVEPPTLELAPLAEEPTQPENGYVAYYLDEDGNKVWLTQEELDVGRASYEEELKRREAEAKAEKEWWESRQDWIDRFPFEPTHYPEIVYDPEAYDPSGVREWPEEKKDDAYWKMRDLVKNHGFLRDFYESKLPYTEEFEQMHSIITEEIGEFDNIFDFGRTFNSLKKYHQARAKAPDAIYRKNARVRRPVPPQKPTFVVIEDLPPEERATFQSIKNKSGLSSLWRLLMKSTRQTIRILTTRMKCEMSLGRTERKD